MKIEKYNQRLLAILGSIGVIFLIVLLISFIPVAIREFTRSYNYDNETGILSDEKIEKLQKEKKREQVISYESPRLIDTLNSKFIIPVSYKTLDKKEDINGTLNAFSSSPNYDIIDDRYSRSSFGNYNNVIIYNPNVDSSLKVFNDRVNFNEIKAEYFDEDIYLLMNVADQDTYKDGVINLKDFKSLYIYNMNKNKLQHIKIEGMDVFKYEFINESKNLFISFGLDKNNDGNYNEYNEPLMIKKYNLETDKLSNIIPENINLELQKTLEGSQ